MHRTFLAFCGIALALAPRLVLAQPYDITTFDVTSTGPWSDIGKTTLMVPKVPNGSIKLDGAASSQEYGGFQGITITPGTNAWILDFPADRAWDGPADSSFTYFLAHDDDNFYVGVNVQDDIVNSDDPNAMFWNDDAIEIVVDALADRLDNNTDTSKDKVGGHSYVNYQGRFSAWDDATGQLNTNSVWATGVDWKYGQNGDVFGVGKAVAGGWQMNVRFSKRMFQDTNAGNLLKNGYRMGFNIGIDDDDKHGPGLNGDHTRTQDLEIQYFWANRQRRMGYTADYLAALTPEQKASKVWLLDPNTDPNGLPLGIDSNGRLSHGGTGEILFGYDANATASGKILFVTSNADSPINADPALIALFKAKGYTVTLLTSGIPPADFRAAAVGQDLVFISESIGSTSVLDPVGDATGVFALKDTDIPVISYEAYMWDNADWVVRTADGSNDFSRWGNTGRNDNNGQTNGVPAAIQDARDSLYIQKPNHPIAAGLSGKVKVYNTPYSLNYGLPSAEADVIASVQADGSYPTLFVYEKGKKLADGSIAPNRRIGLFLGQAASPNANWPTDYADLSDAGRTLLLNTIAYATSKTGTTPTLSVARNGQNLVITYAGGTLQSADAVTGTWNNESAASPVTIQPTATTKFYRVKGG
jgi:Carbohydrate family 9 binding domain-like